MPPLHPLFAAASLFSLASPAAEDWPQWRGPARNGVSTETAWASKGEPGWERNVGMGYSTVSVAAGRLYTLGFDKESEKDVLWCLDAATGEVVWKHEYDGDLMAKFHEGGSLTTPSIDGDDVYVVTRQARFLKLAAEDGKVQWDRDLKKDYGVEQPTWGFAASPLLLDDMVILNLGKVLAFDGKTGKEKWKSADYGHAYSTPTDFELEGRPCLAVFAGKGLALLDRRTGKELWLYPWKTKYDINAASPIVFGDKVFISSGYGHGCAMLRLGQEKPEVLWESKAMQNKMSGCVLVGEHLYGFDEALLKCLDLRGEEKWVERGLGNGALTAAGERLILMSSRGELIVAGADPEGFEEFSREKVLDGGVYWTTPILVDGRIYCRNNRGDLVCRDHRNQDL